MLYIIVSLSEFQVFIHTLIVLRVPPHIRFHHDDSSTFHKLQVSTYCLSTIFTMTIWGRLIMRFASDLVLNWVCIYEQFLVKHWGFRANNLMQRCFYLPQVEVCGPPSLANDDVQSLEHIHRRHFCLRH